MRVLHALAAATALLGAAAAHAATVLFIATGNVPAGKFRQLAEIARPHGVTVEMRYVHRLPAEVDEGLFRGADAVFFDTYQIDEVRDRLARALPGLVAPHVWLYDARPAWRGVPDALAQRLVAYYNSGGRANFDGFFASLAAHFAGRPPEGIAAPVVFPKSAIYHPQAPGQVFADAAAYFAWKKPAAGAPTVAIALHQQYIASMQTAYIDDLIHRIEAAGGVALPFYAPMLDAAALGRLLAPAGRPLAQALINTQITLNPEGRRAEFERLGIPVVQAMTYRRGDEAAWAADPQGVALMDVPFYLAQAEFAGITDIQIASAARREDEQIAAIAPQAAAVANKALRLVRLQTLPNAEKKLAVFFWNYPPGEKNLSASFMNLPRSLEGTLAALKAAGYRSETPQEAELIGNLQQLLAPAYRDGQLETLLQNGLADVVGDVGIGHRHVADGEHRVVMDREAALLAGQPFLRAVGAVVHQGVGLELLARPQIDGEVEVRGRRLGRVVEGLLLVFPFLAARRLRQDGDVAELVARDDEMAFAVAPYRHG